jgi:YVTN family beta-propeller protein
MGRSMSSVPRLPAIVLLLVVIPALSVGCSGGAADPGTLVVLTHGPSGEVRFLQIGSGKITGRTVVGGEPHRLVRDAARGRVYVLDRAGDSVAVVDVLTHEVVERVRVGREPQFAALAPDGRRLYVTVAAENVLAVVDAESLAVVERVPVGNRPMGVAVSSDGSRVFVANDGDGTIMAGSLADRRRFRRPLPVSGGVHGGAALSNDGTTLLSGAQGRPALVAMSLSDQRVTEIPLGATARTQARTVLATPDGRYWLAALAGSDEIVAVPAGGGEPAAIPVGVEPSGVVVAPGGRVLVASRGDRDLVEVDLDKGKVTRRIRVGDGHTDVTVFSKAALDALRE